MHNFNFRLHSSSRKSVVAAHEQYCSKYRQLSSASRQQLAAKTLTELGLKSSQAAMDAGYICVVPPQAGSFRSTAGEWVAQSQLSLLEELLAKDLAWNEEFEARKLQEQAAKEEKKIVRQLPKAVTELMSKTGLARKEVKGLLDDELHRALAKARLATVPVEHALVVFRDWQWQGISFEPKKNGYPAEAGLVPVKGEKAVRALLKNNLAEFCAAVDEVYQGACHVASLETEKWGRDRPVWFDGELLIAYEKSFLSELLSGKRALSHPLEGMPMVQAVLKSPKNGVKYGEKYVKGIPDATAVHSQLWGHKTLPEGVSLVQLANKVVEEQVLAEIERQKAEFLNECSVAFTEPGEFFTADGWHAVLDTSFKRALKDDVSRSYKKSHALTLVGESLHNARELAKARACFSALPASVKDFYPLARQLNRKITFFMGPTNSGKTHRALSALAGAASGVYLGPLRLLALEVHERLTEMGVANSLVTGEQVKTVPGAQHMAATIEMLDTNSPVEVAVIDEVQMLHDPERGSAWLRAVMGAPARHVILAGPANALPMVKVLFESTGEPLEVVELSRLNNLEVLGRPTALGEAKPGTALVVFSRKEALALAEHVRTKLKKSVAVVYGALSPDVRREQANLFRSGQAEVLVATDAIAMGLNLPIKTVLFTTAVKWNGKAEVKIPLSLVRQIAGRAGRYGLRERGHVGALNSETLKHVRRALNDEHESTLIKVRVPFDLVIAETISRHIGATSLCDVLNYFSIYLKLEPWASPGVNEGHLLSAEYLDRFNLTLEQKVRLLNAPAWKGAKVSYYFSHMLRCIELGKVEQFDYIQRPSSCGLEEMEQRVWDLTLYCWMHYRYPELFPRVSAAHEVMALVNDAISEALKKVEANRCNACYRPLPWNCTLPKCDKCHKAGWGGGYFEDYDEYDDHGKGPARALGCIATLKE